MSTSPIVFLSALTWSKLILTGIETSNSEELSEIQNYFLSLSLDALFHKI